MSSVEGWSLGFGEDVDLPGWLFLPEGLTSSEQDLWLESATELLWSVIGSGPDPAARGTEEMVRSMLADGLAARSASPSYAMYMVWPVLAPAAVMCHIDFTASDDLPDWKELDGVVHAADARYLGPGVQYSTRRQIEAGGGLLDLSSVHFVFDDGEVALMLTLEESISTLVSHAAVGFTRMKDALQVLKGDGTAFVSKVVPEYVRDEQWVLSDHDGAS
ncbi:hypothetical protein ACW14X_12930 [Nocardioides sp. YJ-D4]